MEINIQNTKFRDKVGQHYIVRNITNFVKKIAQDRITKLSLTFWFVLVLLAVFGPIIKPYEHDAQHFNEDGSLMRTEPPSRDHLLGTTYSGEDVLSQLIYGVQPTIIVGLLGGFLIITAGTLVGVTSGYAGGRTDSLLMRFTDFVYGVPLIPFAIVLASVIGVGFWSVIILIGAILWRGSARVIRSQVLQIKERSYIHSVQAVGASDLHIIMKHIVPNIGNMIVLYLALGIGYSILFQANLAFLGITDPFVPTWGVMIRNAYHAGQLASAWWWSLTPGILISLTVVSVFMIGRGYESMTQEQQLLKGQ